MYNSGLVGLVDVLANMPSCQVRWKKNKFQRVHLQNVGYPFIREESRGSSFSLQNATTERHLVIGGFKLHVM